MEVAASSSQRCSRGSHVGTWVSQGVTQRFGSRPEGWAGREGPTARGPTARSGFSKFIFLGSFLSDTCHRCLHHRHSLLTGSRAMAGSSLIIKKL